MVGDVRARERRSHGLLGRLERGAQFFEATLVFCPARYKNADAHVGKGFEDLVGNDESHDGGKTVPSTL